MRISLSTDSFRTTKADFLAVSAGTAHVDKDPALTALAKSMGGTALADAIKDEGFTGKVGQVLKLQAHGRLAARWVIVVGVGKDAGKPAAARLLASAPFPPFVVIHAVEASEPGVYGPDPGADE